MFSEVFKRRGADEVEDYILVGTLRTTPPIDVVETGWPKPWLFFRLLPPCHCLCRADLHMYGDRQHQLHPGIMFLARLRFRWRR